METLLAENYDLAFRLPASHLAATVEAASTGMPWWPRRKPKMTTFLGSDGGVIEVPAGALAAIVAALWPLLADRQAVTMTIGPPRPSVLTGEPLCDITITPRGEGP